MNLRLWPLRNLQEPAMEGLTRLVSESLARHGFDRPLDYRRLHWSRWFRCESHHSLLSVPSKPGVFAVAEEIMGLAPSNTCLGTGVQAERSSAAVSNRGSLNEQTDREAHVEERRFSAASSSLQTSAALAAEGPSDGNNRTECVRRLLAVAQFFEADDMAFVLDRMLTRNNPMRARLASGRYFVRYVVIEDESQRRSISAALNQWMASAGEKASGIGAHFASSLELTDATAHISADVSPAHAECSSASETISAPTTSTTNSIAASQLDSGAAANLHCPSPFPSGF
jgi:hypothetical protein